MKKLLSFLLTALLATSVGWAAEVTFDLSTAGSTNGDEVTTITQDGVTLTFSKGSGSIAPAWYNGAVRIYTAGTLTISSTNAITKINFTSPTAANTVQGGLQQWTASTGSYEITQTSSPSTAEWTGSANSILFSVKPKSGNNNYRVYLTEIVVTTEGGSSTVATPTFNPAAGTYTQAQNVSISCTTSGATIHYTTDGSTPTASSTVYSTPIAVNSTTTIKAIAVKSGMTNSAVATATYTINLPTTVPDLPSANELTDAISFIFTGNAVVVYKSDDYIWLRDLGATAGGGMFYNASNEVNNVCTVGTVLAPNWTATKTTYRGWIEYTNADNVAANTQYDTQTIEPFDRTDVELTDANMNEYIILKGVTVNGNTATTENGTSYTLYNRFNTSMTDDTKYNMIAIVGKYVYGSTNTMQVYPISVTEVKELTIKLNPPTASATIGETIQVTVTIENAEGDYMATYKIGDGVEQDCQNGDVIDITSATAGTVTLTVSVIDEEENEATATGTYTFTEPVQPSDGNVYVKVTDDAELEVGKKYIIICEEYSSGMGPVAKVGSNSVGTVIDGLTITSDDEVDIDGTDVMELTLGGSQNEGWTFINDNGEYIAWYSGNTLITRDEVNNDSKWKINDNYSISNYATTERRLQYNYNSGNPRFACYTSSQKLAVLYVQKPAETPVGFTGTLKDVEDPESAVAVGTEVIITDELIGTWASGNLLWVKDQSQQPNDVRPACQQDQIDFLRDLPMHYVVNDQTEEYYWQKNAWDESNWIVLDFSKVSNREGETINSFVGKKLTGVKGTYADNVNFTIELSEAPAIGDGDGDYPGYSDQNYPKPDRIDYDWGYNTYFPANFFTSNQNKENQNGIVEGFVTHDVQDTDHPESTVNLYFMNPKIQEVARIWGAWNGSAFAVYTDDGHSHYNPCIDGVVNADWTYNINGDVSSQLVENQAYCFHAVVRKPSTGLRAAEASSSGASGDYAIYPLDFVSAETNVTVVEETNVAKTVQSVRYYNVMGMESAQPFNGLNIIVTRYTDGTSSAVKVIR